MKGWAGPWKVNWGPGSKIRTDLAIFGVKVGSFSPENPDGLAKICRKVGAGVRTDGFCQAGGQIPDPDVTVFAQQEN